MAQTGKPKVSPAQLRKAYKQDLTAAWELGRSKHPEQTPYALVLYGVEGGQPPQFTPCLLTEESLTRVAQRYLEGGHHDTLDEARAALRYSVADSPFVGELEGFTPTVDAVVAPYATVLDDDTGYAILAKAAIAALRELDAEGIFGTGPERERLLLVIITEDTPKDWSKESARKLNPPSVFQRFEAETKVEGTFACSDAIAVSPDGHSLYADVTNSNPNGKPDHNEFLDQIVAFDVTDPRLGRRWVFDFTGMGESVRTLACDPDSRTVVALRAKYVGSVCNSILLRFPRDSNEPTMEHRFIGEPAGLSMAVDGSLMAVALHNKTLHFFDANLRPLGTHTFDVKVYAPHFLRNGDLLVPSDAGVLRLRANREEPAAVVAPYRSFRLATDDANAFLAVSRWFSPSSIVRKDIAAFGIQLLRLPSFDLVRTFDVPDQCAVTPALSRDGRLIAFEAHEIEKPRKFVSVFDTTTGKEVARRKSNFVKALVFLPDNQTLAIAASAITTTEPIELWKIPRV